MQPSGIVYLSGIPWAFTRHREHEMACGLSSFLPTLYVNPPQLRLLKTGLQADPVRVADGLYTLITYAPVLGYRNLHLANVAVRRGLARQIGHALDSLQMTRPILIVDDVGYLPVLDRLGGGLVVFDCVDRPWAFRRVASVRLLKRYFYDLARRADLVLASSRSLCAELGEINAHVHLVLNAGDYEHFCRAGEGGLPEPADLAPIPRPRLVIMAYSFPARTDFEMIWEAARRRPAWQFVFLGTTLLPPGYDPPPNVHLLGEHDYSSLPQYLAHCDVCVGTYRLGTEFDYIFPKKLFEYLATGKPVVMSALPEVLPYADVVRTPRTTHELVADIEAGLAELADPEAHRTAAQRRQAIARANTWDQRMAQVIQILQAAVSQGSARDGEGGG